MVVLQTVLRKLKDRSTDSKRRLVDRRMLKDRSTDSELSTAESSLEALLTARS